MSEDITIDVDRRTGGLEKVLLFCGVKLYVDRRTGFKYYDQSNTTRKAQLAEFTILKEHQI